MEYFVYGRDLPGSGDLKGDRTGDHWAFMDGYAKELIARGPTLTGPAIGLAGTDDEPDSTGSLHIVDLPDDEAARKFAYEEPYYLAGVFESVLLCRFRNILGRTMWEFTDAVEGYNRYLVITMDDAEPAPVTSKHVIVYGELLDLDGTTRLGWAATVEAPDEAAAATLVPASGTGRTEVHHWRFGGRPDQQS